MLPQLASVLCRIAAIQERIHSLEPSSSGAHGLASFEVEFARATAALEAPERCPRTVGNAPTTRSDFDRLIQAAATRHGVDADLVHAVIQAESGYNPNCRSSAGALGLMQLMPGTARALGVSDPLDPEANIEGGVKYLRQQLDRFHDVDLALAAYNAGPGAVRRYDGIPPYRETQAYVRRVLQTLWQRKAE